MTVEYALDKLQKSSRNLRLFSFVYFQLQWLRNSPLIQSQIPGLKMLIEDTLE